jgi:glycosyl transferase family 25
MKSYVITIKKLDRSVEIAERCIESGKMFGIDIIMFDAITPENDVYKIARERDINLSGFDERYSRKENAIACFLSHHSLWGLSVETNEPILILEHDAVFTRRFDTTIDFKSLLSIGKPSYGRYNTPAIGISPLTSKSYLPGAHAYIIKPHAAKELINKSKVCARPTDVFIDRRIFPWIEELYPWPVEVKDTFTTVQKTAGCVAKHSYKEGFEII